MRLFVLWEDQRAPGTRPNQYGPEALLRAAVADHIATPADWHAASDHLRRAIASKACKGIDKLLGELAQDALYRGGRTVLAIYDGDRIRRHLQLPNERTDAQVNAEIARRAGRPMGDLVPRPIGDNLEALVAGMARIAGHALTEEEQGVISRKVTRGEAQLTRDRVLQRHATGTDAMREFRRQLEQSMETWREIVDAAVKAIS